MQGTWKQALISFLGPVLLVLVFRWLLFEPFVIPSGSMIPTLLIHDHILVNKLAYGIHIPGTQHWIVQWAHPEAREVAVFKFPRNPDVFYVKRIVAVAGDAVEVRQGRIFRNGIEIPQESLPQKLKSGQSDEEEFQYFTELGSVIRYREGDRDFSDFHSVKVPANHFFVMGDNRDQSSDSRSWGFVPESNLVGRASVIWLSCDSTLTSAPFLCDPQTLRFSRFFQRVNP